MHPSKRLMWMVALTVLVAAAAACGGQPAEEPATTEEPAGTEEPAAEEATPTTQAAMEPEPEPEPAQTLTGTITEIGEGEFNWLNAATREVPGRYYWEVELRNDTTQTLDLTVTWQFLDENEEVVKTDRVTVRVPPAETSTFRGEGEMERDDARSVAFTSYSWDWDIVEG